MARARPTGRNVLALFPSYAFLARWRPPAPVPTTLLVQQPGSSDGERRELLDACGRPAPDLVLAVLGGIFAEGVDYPGEMLSEVIVVSPALPQFNPERELLKAYFQEVYGRGFEYAYLIPGLTRVVQAAGRLIRSDTTAASSLSSAADSPDATPACCRPTGSRTRHPGMGSSELTAAVRAFFDRLPVAAEAAPPPRPARKRAGTRASRAGRGRRRAEGEIN